MLEKLYDEDEFYQEDGWPTEEYALCRYVLTASDDEAGDADFDQFALITNAIYPYIRLTKRRGKHHFPCGASISPSTDGWFASKTPKERDMLCPKIARGFAAHFLAHIRYDVEQNDYVLLKDLTELVRIYYKKYLDVYLKCHNGLKYGSLTLNQKEENFLKDHEAVEESLWAKSERLKPYTELYDYASEAVDRYKSFLVERKELIKNEMEVIITEDRITSRVTTGEMHPNNEAYFEGIAQKILEVLDQAKAQIDVCVAWFTNPLLRDKLLEKSKEGVAVRVIINKDCVNRTRGVDLSGLNHKEYRGKRGGVLHDKFCVIDNVHTISGSYNWTLNAEHKNDEDAAFHFEDYTFASSYTKRFNQIWKRDDI